MSFSNQCSRREGAKGFSLIELAMVGLILGVAVVITIPVVLKSQTQARQSGCAMRLANLAQATLAYEQANGRLPVAGLVDPSSTVGAFNQGSGRQLSWVVLTLPHLGYQDVFDEFDFNLTASEQSDAATGRSLPRLICPIDNRGAKAFQHGALQNRVFALGNYAAYISPVHGEHEEVFKGALGGFEPGTDQGQRLAQITDGAAVTFMLSEVRRRPEGGSQSGPLGTTRPSNIVRDSRGVWALPWVGSSTLAFDLHSIGGSGGFGLDGPYEPDPNQNPEDTQTPNHQIGISDQAMHCPRPAAAVLDGMPCTRLFSFAAAAPRSLHPGGVNTAFVDGHVEFTSDGIDPVLMAHLICVDNGQPIVYRPKASKFGRASKRRDSQ